MELEHFARETTNHNMRGYHADTFRAKSQYVKTFEVCLLKESEDLSKDERRQSMELS